MDKYTVAVYIPTLADAVLELEGLKNELEKIHGIRIIRAMKRGTPTLETERGMVHFYSKWHMECHVLFGKNFSKLFNFPIKYHTDTFGRELDHTEFDGSFLDYILKKEKE